MSFRDQVRRRLSGELNEEEFKPLRLMNGVYLQLHAYMLRIAIPYGTLSATRCARLPMWPGAMTATTAISPPARTSSSTGSSWKSCPTPWRTSPAPACTAPDLGQLHPQHHHRSLGAATPEERSRIPASMRRSSGSGPRSTRFTYLPRKFKIAITAAKHDRAAIRVHDIGLRLHQRDGETGFEVIVGGGLGRTPFVGKTIREFLPRHHLLSYLEAVLRTYNAGGRRDNIYKAASRSRCMRSAPRNSPAGGRGMGADQGRRPHPR